MKILNMNIFIKFLMGFFVNCIAIIFSQAIIYDYFLRLLVVKFDAFEFLTNFYIYSYLIVIIIFIFKKQWAMMVGALLSMPFIWYIFLPLVIAG
jgi:hypothetical protein